MLTLLALRTRLAIFAVVERAASRTSRSTGVPLAHPTPGSGEVCTHVLSRVNRPSVTTPREISEAAVTSGAVGTSVVVPASPGAAFHQREEPASVFDRLPNELLVQVLSFVGCSDVTTTVHAVCRRWRDACRMVPVDLGNCHDLLERWVYARYKTHFRLMLGDIVSDVVLAVLKDFAGRFEVYCIPSEWHAASDAMDVAQCCPQLRTMEYTIKRTLRRQTAAAITQIAQSCPHIEVLSFVDVRRRQKEQCAFIQEWHFSHPTEELNVTVTTLTRLGHLFRKLRKVILLECTALTDAGIQGLVAGARTLQFLQIHGSPGITDAGLERAAQCAVSLKCVFVVGCDGITYQCIDPCERSGVVVIVRQSV